MWKWGECRVESNELMHWGILGQKWGIRRFQNKDGSLTEEGKKRYQNKDGTLNEAGKDRLEKKFNEAYEMSKKSLDGRKKPDKKDYKDKDLYYDDLGEYKDIIASHKVNKGIKDFFEKNKNATVSQLEDEYDRLFSENFDVYLPYVKELRKKNNESILD